MSAPNIEGTDNTYVVTGGAFGTSVGTSLQFKSYTLATLPVGEPVNSIVAVSDMSGNVKLAVTDGTSWFNITDGSVAS